MLIERGELDEAEAHLRSVTMTPDARAHDLGLRLDRRAGASCTGCAAGSTRPSATLRRARELVRARGWTTPLKSLAGLRLAAALAERGRTEEALAVLDEEEAARAGRARRARSG